ncbi:hypothetical protein FRX31_011234 [Thalictrum thalictroides]|uniref:ATPase V1 complex subunit H C-terminal domain-containing protein n=1 Tax=Thalictrum thalictroides TaxID=46969 RepID=A0A7J6WP77_THATH|nr:hypothetical protein FRX31_011234 [Thalictrum thalictroides]
MPFCLIRVFSWCQYWILRVLITILETSSDPKVLAVACYDLSPFIQYHPTGQIIVTDLKTGGRLVAYGTIATNSDDTTYKVMIDEVEDWKGELFGVIGKTFRDTDIGDTIEWPTILTRLL